MIARTLSKKRASPNWFEALAYISLFLCSIVVVVWPQFVRVPTEEKLKFIEMVRPFSASGARVHNFRTIQNTYQTSET